MSEQHQSGVYEMYSIFQVNTGKGRSPLPVKSIGGDNNDGANKIRLRYPKFFEEE